MFCKFSPIFANNFMDMRKILQSFILPLALTGVITACHNSRTGDTAGAGDFEFERVIVDTIVGLTSADNTPKAEIHLNIMYARGEKSSTLNDSLLRTGILSPDYLALAARPLDVPLAVDSFVIRYANDYRRDYGRLYSQDREHGASYQVQYTCNTFLKKGTDEVTNYVAEIYYYGGGEHGQQLTVVKHFNPQTGHIVKPSDLFTSGYEQSVADLLVEKLFKENDVKDLKELRKKNIMMGLDPYMPDNFLVEDGQVTFIYNESEIAPHAKGEIRITLKDSELKDILK